MAARQVLSVGQCAADHGSITRAVRKHFDAEVVPADNFAEALALLRAEKFDVVLANRVFDTDGASGVELVKLIKADEQLRPVPVILVSNYDDAQEQAAQAGAAPGFGKASLGLPRMVASLKPFIG